MRIALVSPSLRLGGVDMVSVRLGEQFQKAGHSVTFVETYGVGEWSDTFRRWGHDVVTIPLRWYESSIRHTHRVSKALAVFDVVILSDDAFGRASLGGIPTATRVIPILHTDLDGQYRTAIGNGRDYDMIVAVSEAIRCCATETLGVDPSRIVHIPSGVEVPDVWPKENTPVSTRLHTCYVGRLSDWHKGVWSLPEILGKALELGADVDLEVVGDGPDQAEMLRCFASADLEGHYQCRGALERDGVQEALRRADVLILPSNFEGFPIAPLEAMAAGVVPIVTRLPKSTDLMIEDGVSGVLVDRGDYGGFAGALARLCQDRGKLREMSRAAWVRAKCNFSLETMGQRYLELIEKIVAGPDPEPRSGRIDDSLLGDLPWLPSGLVRPVRKLMRTFRLWPLPSV